MWCARKLLPSYYWNALSAFSVSSAKASVNYVIRLVTLVRSVLKPLVYKCHLTCRRNQFRFRSPGNHSYVTAFVVRPRVWSDCTGTVVVRLDISMVKWHLPFEIPECSVKISLPVWCICVKISENSTVLKLMESYDVIANQPVVIDNVRGKLPPSTVFCRLH